jgi:hypothetical protein
MYVVACLKRRGFPIGVEHLCNLIIKQKRIKATRRPTNILILELLSCAASRVHSIPNFHHTSSYIGMAGSDLRKHKR